MNKMSSKSENKSLLIEKICLVIDMGPGGSGTWDQGGPGTWDQDIIDILYVLGMCIHIRRSLRGHQAARTTVHIQE